MEVGNRGPSDGARPKHGNDMKYAEIPLKCIATQARSRSDEFMQKSTVCPQYDTVSDLHWQPGPFRGRMTAAGIRVPVAALDG
jgi:hypothetical protein